jgi:hypothetical protein
VHYGEHPKPLEAGIRHFRRNGSDSLTCPSGDRPAPGRGQRPEAGGHGRGRASIPSPTMTATDSQSIARRAWGREVGQTWSRALEYHCLLLSSNRDHDSGFKLRHGNLISIVTVFCIFQMRSLGPLKSGCGRVLSSLNAATVTAWGHNLKFISVFFETKMYLETTL